MGSLKERLIQSIQNIDDSGISEVEFMNQVMDEYYKQHPFKHNPVTKVKYVPISKVKANNYNPNSVATKEMELLHTSISHDGYTQPTVTIYDSENDKYIIVDGFHRYTCCARYKDINELNNGYLPIVIIEKSLAERMASTVRHNRARGKHAIEGMSNIVIQMLKSGMSDAKVCMELGLEIDELIKLKHVTGFAKLFEDTQYSQSWETTRQIMNKQMIKSKESLKEKQEVKK